VSGGHEAEVGHAAVHSAEGTAAEAAAGARRKQRRHYGRALARVKQLAAGL